MNILKSKGRIGEYQIESVTLSVCWFTDYSRMTITVHYTRILKKVLLHLVLTS